MTLMIFLTEFVVTGFSTVYFKLRSQPMNEAFQVRLAVIENDVSAASIPDACRCVATWHIVQLSALYAKLRETSGNRYFEEIAVSSGGSSRNSDNQEGVSRSTTTCGQYN